MTEPVLLHRLLQHPVSAEYCSDPSSVLPDVGYRREGVAAIFLLLPETDFYTILNGEQYLLDTRKILDTRKRQNEKRNLMSGGTEIKEQ